MGSFAICMVIAIAIPMMLTLIVGKKKLTAGDRGIVSEVQGTASADSDEKETNTANENIKTDNVESLSCTSDKNTLTAFLTGKVIPLKEVNDGVFSEGVMGDGVAIIPENDVLYAPADAQVTVLMDESRHACGLKLDNDMEILLHIGIELSFSIILQEKKSQYRCSRSGKSIINCWVIIRMILQTLTEKSLC